MILLTVRELCKHKDVSFNLVCIRYGYRGCLHQSSCAERYGNIGLGSDVEIHFQLRFFRIGDHFREYNTQVLEEHSSLDSMFECINMLFDSFSISSIP